MPRGQLTLYYSDVYRGYLATGYYGFSRHTHVGYPKKLSHHTLEVKEVIRVPLNHLIWGCRGLQTLPDPWRWSLLGPCSHGGGDSLDLLDSEDLLDVTDNQKEHKMIQYIPTRNNSR